LCDFHKSAIGRTFATAGGLPTPAFLHKLAENNGGQDA